MRLYIRRLEHCYIYSAYKTALNLNHKCYQYSVGYFTFLEGLCHILEPCIAVTYKCIEDDELLHKS